MGKDSDKKRQDMFFGGGKTDDLDDLPEIGSTFQKNEDKFNQVMASSKEGGGLLASIGLKKDDVNKDESIADDSQEEDPHKKSDLFDTSKDRIGAKGKDLGKKATKSDEGDFDLGFGSSKKDKEAIGGVDADLGGMSDEDEITEE